MFALSAHETTSFCFNLRINGQLFLSLETAEPAFLLLEKNVNLARERFGDGLVPAPSKSSRTRWRRSVSMKTFAAERRDVRFCEPHMAK
jgi:hypothetical protein